MVKSKREISWSIITGLEVVSTRVESPVYRSKHTDKDYVYNGDRWVRVDVSFVAGLGHMKIRYKRYERLLYYMKGRKWCTIPKYVGMVLLRQSSLW